MSGKHRLWLAVGVAAALVGFALWRNVPAVNSLAPRAKDHTEPMPRTSGMAAEPQGAQTAKRRSAAAERMKAFEELKRRARAGDALAQRKLAEAYDACHFVNVDRDRFLRGLHANRSTLSDPAQLALLDRVAGERLAQCDVVDGGQIVPSELIRTWYAQAAENGDLVGRLMDNAFRRKELDAAASSQLLEEVLGSNDPAAVFAMGGTLRSDYSILPNDPAEALVRGELASTAWMMAACRMGYDCGPTGVVMGNTCLTLNLCTGEDYETFWKQRLHGEAERRELERRVTDIVRAVEGP